MPRRDSSAWGKGSQGGSDPAPPHEFILSKNQVKLQQGEFYAAQKVFTWLLCGHRTCTRLANTEDAGGSVPAPCQPHTLRSPVGQRKAKVSQRGSAFLAKQARRKRRPEAGWRGEGQAEGRGRGRVCLPGQSDGLAFSRALPCTA